MCYIISLFHLFLKIEFYEGKSRYLRWYSIISTHRVLVFVHHYTRFSTDFDKLLVLLWCVFCLLACILIIYYLIHQSFRMIQSISNSMQIVLGVILRLVPTQSCLIYKLLSSKIQKYSRNNKNNSKQYINILVRVILIL